jgi:hypothetical protein
MDATINAILARRTFLAGTAAVSFLALPGCSSLGGLSMVDAVRRLLEVASSRAFSRLTAQDGYWNSAIGRIGLPDLFGSRGGVVQGILTSAVFRDRLQRSLNGFAEAGARRAAPVVTEAVRTIGIDNAIAIIRGEPTAATSFLRSAMGPAVLNAMVPGLNDAMRVANDPLVNQAISALAGVKLGDIAQSVAIGAENGLWSEVGAAEADIRRNPEQTNDAVLISALKVL